MHRYILIGAGALAYYLLALYGLSVFNAQLIVSTIVLFALPAYLLARFSAAPSVVIVTVAAFGAGIALILESLAHIYGIWYTLGVDELRLFGLVPIEILFATIVQTLFLVLLYELVFDDGAYTATSMRSRLVGFILFATAALALVFIHQYLLKGVFLAHSYVWILGALCAASIVSLALHKRISLSFLRRLSVFTLCAGVPLLISAYLAVLNTHKVFANVYDYLFTFTIGGNMVPVEEFVMVLALPLFVATFYEMYLDDGK